jgi:hypothetical protein
MLSSCDRTADNWWPTALILCGGNNSSPFKTIMLQNISQDKRSCGIPSYIQQDNTTINLKKIAYKEFK